MHGFRERIVQAIRCLKFVTLHLYLLIKPEDCRTVLFWFEIEVYLPDYRTQKFRDLTGLIRKCVTIKPVLELR